jgi:hypothetical protein
MAEPDGPDPARGNKNTFLFQFVGSPAHTLVDGGRSPLLPV